MVPLEHGKEEVGQSMSLVFPDVVLLVEHRLEWPVIQTLDLPQVTAVVEELAAILAGQSQILGHAAEEFHHLRQVVIVLVVVVALARLEQEFTGDHFEDRACERPDISRGVVVGADDDLGRAVLSRLDLGSEVVVRPAAIAHIANLDHDSVVELAASLALQVLQFFIFLLHLVDRLLWLVLLGLPLIRFSNINVDFIDLDVLLQGAFLIVLLADLAVGSGTFRFLSLLLALFDELFAQIFLLLLREALVQILVLFAIGDDRLALGVDLGHLGLVWRLHILALLINELARLRVDSLVQIVS